MAKGKTVNRATMLARMWQARGFMAVWAAGAAADAAFSSVPLSALAFAACVPLWALQAERWRRRLERPADAPPLCDDG